MESSAETTPEVEPPNGLGYIGRRVWIHGVASSGTMDDPPAVGCQVWFDMGAQRLVEFTGYGDSNKPSSVVRGVDFQLEPAGSYDGVQAVGQVADECCGWTPTDDPNACQTDSGVVQASDCGPHDAAITPARFIQWRDNADTYAVYTASRADKIWWLGPELRGFGATALYSTENSPEIVYQVADNGRAWQVWVATADSTSPTPPGCEYFHPAGQPSICDRSGLVAQRLAARQIDANHWVEVFSASWNVQQPREPIPTSIANQIRQALRPVPKTSLATS